MVIEIIRADETAARELKLAALQSRNVAFAADLLAQVGHILEDVRQRGDAAVSDYTEQFDTISLGADEFRVTEADLRKIAGQAQPGLLQGLQEAIRRVRLFHERQREESWTFTDELGVVLGQRVRPLEIVGLYVPGGTASYPSSVVMNVVPAQVAGVARIIVVTPPHTLRANPAVAAALVELGISEVYQIGGAQAVAALAFGTETVPRVDKITGPGNKYVAAAKKLVFGSVGIDSLAGPSEIVIIADETAPPEFVAADMLAQAEHAEDAAALLITPDPGLAQKVADALKRQLTALPRRAIAESSIGDFGAIFLVRDLTEAQLLADRIAPEHLEIITMNAAELAEDINHAGALFLGSYTPEALGDYLAGPNHVLPTGGTARFSSALGVYDFIKRTSILQFPAQEMARLAPIVAVLAEAEGLSGHARSATIRQP